MWRVIVVIVCGVLVCTPRNSSAKSFDDVYGELRAAPSLRQAGRVLAQLSNADIIPECDRFILALSPRHLLALKPHQIRALFRFKSHLMERLWGAYGLPLEDAPLSHLDPMWLDLVRTRTWATLEQFENILESIERNTDVPESDRRKQYVQVLAFMSGRLSALTRNSIPLSEPTALLILNLLERVFLHLRNFLRDAKELPLLLQTPHLLVASMPLFDAMIMLHRNGKIDPSAQATFSEQLSAILIDNLVALPDILLRLKRRADNVMASSPHIAEGSESPLAALRMLQSFLQQIAIHIFFNGFIVREHFGSSVKATPKTSMSQLEAFYAEVEKRAVHHQGYNAFPRIHEDPVSEEYVPEWQKYESLSPEPSPLIDLQMELRQGASTLVYSLHTPQSPSWVISLPERLRTLTQVLDENAADEDFDDPAHPPRVAISLQEMYTRFRLGEFQMGPGLWVQFIEEEGTSDEKILVYFLAIDETIPERLKKKGRMLIHATAATLLSADQGMPVADFPISAQRWRGLQGMGMAAARTNVLTARGLIFALHGQRLLPANALGALLQGAEGRKDLLNCLSHLLAKGRSATIYREGSTR